MFLEGSQLELLNLGSRFIPIQGNKTPCEGGWQNSGYTLERFIELYQSNGFKTYRKVEAIGVVLGTGLIAIDLDGESAFAKACEISGLNEPLPHTVSFSSGKPHRRQLLYKYPEEIKISSKQISCAPEELLEFRLKGMQSVIAGKHPHTGRYRWVEGCSPSEASIADCPQWIIDFLLSFNSAPTVPVSKPSLASQVYAAGAIPLSKLISKKHQEIINSGVGQGGRNNGLAALARDLIGAENRAQSQGVDYTESARKLFDIASSRCSPPLPQRELETIWRSAEKGDPNSCLDSEAWDNVLSAWTRKQMAPAHKVATVQVATVSGEIREETFPIEPHGFVVVDGRIGRIEDKLEPKYTLESDGSRTPEFDAKGKIKKILVQKFKPYTNFTFDVVDILDDEYSQNPGLLVEIQEVENPKKARVLIRDTSMHRLADLTRAFSSGYGSTLMNNLKLDQLSELIAAKKEDYIKNGGKRHILSACRGQQPRSSNGKEGYWVFEDIQFTPEGEVCSSEKSGVIFNKTYGEGDEIPNPKILPPNPDILGKVLRAMRRALREQNVYPALFLVASQVMGLHYQKIHRARGHVPMTNAIGDSGGGKSTASKVARALLGLHKTGSAGDCSDSALFENLKYLGGLSYTIEDPKKDPAFDETTKKIYDGEARVKRGNYQKPLSSIIVTSNHAIGRDGAAIMTRFNRIPFFRDAEIGKDQSDFDDLTMDLLDQASGAFQLLLKFGYDNTQVEIIRQRIDKFLPQAHRRISPNLSILTFYALKLAPYAGLSEEQIMNYVSTVLCRVANDQDSGKSSLQDFVEKLRDLESRSLIGPWNYREIQKQNGQRIAAIKLQSVWPIFERIYQVQYDVQQIKADNEQNNGRNDGWQLLATSQREFQAWEVNNLNPDSNQKLYQSKNTRCIEIRLDKFDISPEPFEQDEPTENLEIPFSTRYEQIINAEPKMPKPVEPIDSLPEIVNPDPAITLPEIPKPEPSNAQAIEHEIDDDLVGEIIDELEAIRSSGRYGESLTKYKDNKAEFNLAWHHSAKEVQDRILALDLGEISAIKEFRPIIPRPPWLDWESGQLVIYRGRTYWLVGVAGADCEIPSLRGKNAVEILPVNGKAISQFVEILEVRSWLPNSAAA